MSKQLTLCEIEILRKNPYVKSAYRNMVSFTADFKREYLNRYNEGETGREILSSMGIDPEIVGDSRIWSLVGKFRDELEKYGDFADTRRRSESNLQSASIEQLRIEVEYVKQEVSFLKKNLILDSKA